jgi:hypothetical protein
MVLPLFAGTAVGLPSLAMARMPMPEYCADGLPGLAMTDPPEPEGTSTPPQRAVRQYDRAFHYPLRLPVPLLRQLTPRRRSASTTQQLNTNPDFSFRCTWSENTSSLMASGSLFALPSALEPARLHWVVRWGRHGAGRPQRLFLMPDALL